MQINGIRLNLGEPENTLKERAIKKAKINKNAVKSFTILKKSLDARDKSDIHYVYNVEINEDSKKEDEKREYNLPENKVAVIGFGPAGIFAALYLAREGFKPIIIERGESVEDRKKTIDNFINTRKLNVNSNVQYGEGGAGAFSDGKLSTGVKSEFKPFILEELVKHGAPAEIVYLNKPHIGSDRLPQVVKNIRDEIISLGGEFLFDTKMATFNVDGGKIDSLELENVKTGEKSFLKVSEVVLAIGHSARDTVIALYNLGVDMEEKDLAVGFRIEHKQSLINKSQYGKIFENPYLPVADYKLVSSVTEGRSVFTFCMCPGGVVMPATSEEGAVVTNGMSNYARDGENANSAVVVQVRKEDYGGGIINGIEFLRKLERDAFNAGGGDYSAPCQLVGDFLKGTESKKIGSVKPTYPLGVKLYPLYKLLPHYMIDAIRAGIKDMDKRLKGFAFEEAVLTGIETRTSSPVRITRTESLCNLSAENLYPAGETGHAGGIMSAAIDGLKVASKIAEKYLKV